MQVRRPHKIEKCRTGFRSAALRNGRPEIPPAAHQESQASDRNLGVNGQPARVGAAHAGKLGIQYSKHSLYCSQLRSGPLRLSGPNGISERQEMCFDVVQGGMKHKKFRYPVGTFFIETGKIANDCEKQIDYLCRRGQ